MKKELRRIGKSGKYAWSYLTDTLGGSSFVYSDKNGGTVNEHYDRIFLGLYVKVATHVYNSGGGVTKTGSFWDKVKGE